jgi:hypothetical protein
MDHDRSGHFPECSLDKTKQMVLDGYHHFTVPVGSVLYLLNGLKKF